jgi:hypothetical protein
MTALLCGRVTTVYGRFTRVIVSNHFHGNGMGSLCIQCCLLYHLIGLREQQGWYSEPEFFGSLQVDHQFKTGRLYHRQVSRAYPLRIRPV